MCLTFVSDLGWKVRIRNRQLPALLPLAALRNTALWSAIRFLVYFQYYLRHLCMHLGMNLALADTVTW